MGLEPDGDRAATGAAAGRRAANVVDPRWAAVDWTLRAGGAHGALLVDRARLLLRALRLVRGAGAPDEVPHRDRVQPDVRRVGARIREPRGHPRPDRARSSLGPHRSRVGLDARGASASRSASPPLLSCASRRRRPPVRDGRVAGHAGLRAHLGVRRHHRRDLRGPALRLDLRGAEPGLHRRRRRRTVVDRRAVRRDRQLPRARLDRHRRVRRLGASRSGSPRRARCAPSPVGSIRFPTPAARSRPRGRRTPCHHP